MAQDNRSIAAALNRFGQEVVAPGRDAGIWSHDAMLEDAAEPIRKTAGPRVQARAREYKQLAKLPAEVQQMVRHMIIDGIDESIHALLKQLDDLGDQGAKLTVDGVDILEHTRHELQGYPLTERGWFALYSQYGEHGETPTP